jgi:signal transduction histidine kinase
MQDQQESRARKKGPLAIGEVSVSPFPFVLRQNLGFHLLALYLLFVLPILGAGIYFDVRAGQRLRDDVAAADLSLAQAIALETDALLLKAQQAVIEFAQMPAIINSDLPAMEEAFSTASAARQDINLFYRLDADGIMVFHYPVAPGSTIGVDFSFRDYFKEARGSQGPVFSKGRISPTTQRPVATVVMPVRRPDDRFDGVVATNLELQRLTQTLVGIGREQGSQRGLQVVMVDAVGQVIADSQPEAELLRVVLDELPGARQTLAGEVGSLRAQDESGREWLYSYAPVSSAGWGVIVQRPTEVAFATSRSFHRGLLFALALFLVGATLFWLRLTNGVIRPLEKLTKFGEIVGQSIVPENRGRGGLWPIAERRDQMGKLARTLLGMEEDISRRFNELSTLLETSTAVVSSLDTQQVIDSILEEIQRLLTVDSCAILTVNEASQTLEIRASQGLGQDYVDNLRLDTRDRRWPALRAIDTGQPVQVADVESDPSMASILSLIRAEGFRSLLAVPLITQHAPPAVLVVYRLDAHRFTEAEIDLAANFANHAAMALENASLFNLTDVELQKQVKSLRALNQVALSVSQSLVLDDVLTNAVDAVLHVMETDTAWIYLLREGETTLRLRVHRGFSARFAEQVSQIEVGSGLNGRVAETRQPLLVQDIHLNPGPDQQLLAQEGLCSFAAVPLRAKESNVGVLGVATRDDRQFTADQVDLLSAIGAQVGIAVENARLYRRSRQAAILEERNRVAREIHDSLAQAFTGIVVQLEAAERLAGRRPEQAQVSLQRARDLARTSLQEARRSVWGLRPRSLEELSLTEALHNQIRTAQGENGLTLRFATSGAERNLSADVEMNLFRIAQEALNNVRRHADARNAGIQVDYGMRHVRLVVWDDGIGLPADHRAVRGDGDGHGFGLIGMQERTALLNGQMTITSASGEGTQVEVVVPG